MIHPLVQQQFEVLAQAEPGAELREGPDGGALVGIPAVSTEPASRWSKGQVKVWFIAPLGYPQSKPDCFWADGELRLAGGGLPSNTQLQPVPGLDGQWLWFSWHVSSWNPQSDDLQTYVRVIRRRLKEPR
jgi:hypothetical protein